MSEQADAASNEVMKIGLLMESAHAHQQLAERQLGRLNALTTELDGVVRDVIRRTLVDEFAALTSEAERATESLRDVRRGANRRSVIWNLGTALLCAGLPALYARYGLPTQSEVDALRRQRDALAIGVARLEQQGGKVELRRCGDSGRLCVRVDRHAPVYGDGADYYVVKEY